MILGIEYVNFYRLSIMIKPDPGIKEINMVTSVMVENIGKDQVSINSISLINNILSLYVGCKTHECVY